MQIANFADAPSAIMASPYDVSLVEVRSTASSNPAANLVDNQARSSRPVVRQDVSPAPRAGAG
ncbi:MAG: hypothetical protein PHQ28_10990 [Mycobacterium sp.]|nr:hypothetical protein [Mycobacterium sp.]